MRPQCVRDLDEMDCGIFYAGPESDHPRDYSYGAIAMA